MSPYSFSMNLDELEHLMIEEAIRAVYKGHDLGPFTTLEDDPANRDSWEALFKITGMGVD